jgi:hypothetical protein
VLQVPQTVFDHVGWSVADGGDINGDGYDDILLGALQAIKEAGREKEIARRMIPKHQG